LEELRDLLESGWSAETIHPSYQFGRTRNVSVGQCGVSSAWLVLELSQRFGFDAEYCYGDVVSRNDAAKRLTHHCWVEIEDAVTAEPWVVDITCEQIEHFQAQRVLLALHRVLRAQDVVYTSHSRLKASEVRSSPIGTRLAALDRALAAIHR
jgi:hypothetical protein